MKIWQGIKKRIGAFLYRLKKARLKLRFPLTCRLCGVKSQDRQGALAQTQAGDRLQIVHIPLEDYPYNAYVYSIPLNRILGYLDPNLSQKLFLLFGKSYCRDAVVERITGGGKMKYFGCRIRIFETMTMMRDVTDFSPLHGE